ncbi:hypothetical protein ACFX5D_07725 [Flavobacterium sp. LB3P45]|uniref:LytTr DNA-binding domain-containing protein n=1 Tax=Flavobacterium fructosi TaxID=3230416 RepID=A0ABW6HLE9_9FLAO
MTLTDIEYKAFLRTHLELLFYVGHKSKIIADDIIFNVFVDLNFSIKLKCRDFLLDNKKLLDDYIAENFDKLTTEQISILTGFKKTISSDFVIFKCLTNNAVFIDTKDNRFYAVKALSDSFDQFFDRFPVLVKTTLLPFNDHIIYDGFIKPTGVYFGSGMTSTMKEEYKLAKKNNQILTTI